MSSAFLLRPVRLSFSPPRNGWLHAEIATEDFDVHLSASYLTDAPRDFAHALARLVAGDRQAFVDWETEPGTHLWCLTRIQDTQPDGTTLDLIDLHLWSDKAKLDWHVVPPCLPERDAWDAETMVEIVDSDASLTLLLRSVMPFRAFIETATAALRGLLGPGGDAEYQAHWEVGPPENDPSMPYPHAAVAELERWLASGATPATDAMLAARLEAADAAWPCGTRVRHFKGGLYMVEGVTLDSETGMVRVTYGARGSALTWSRPLSEFEERVPLNGEMVPRFTPIADA